MCTTGGTYYNSTKKIISTNCFKHTVVPPDDGYRYARNMCRLKEYTKNKLCIKLAFLYTVTEICGLLSCCTA